MDGAGGKQASCHCAAPRARPPLTVEEPCLANWSDSTPEPLSAQAPMGMPGWLQGLSLTCPCPPLLENSLFLKLGITWFQGPAFKIPGRPTSTFHGQPCLSQTWVPLPQFLQWVFSILHAVESNPKANRLAATKPERDPTALASLWLHR